MRKNWLLNIQLVAIFGLVVFLYSFTSRRNENRKIIKSSIEILDQNKNGYLFKNGNKEDLVKVFFYYLNDSLKNNFNKRAAAKKISNLFSHFKHFQEISKLIEEN